ncbi:hypothetical protein [Flavimarina sp. Hel_I_48]|uniref:hypothetical protein n=1 Tax=Flavimarina sp. Hel_I_48 TaxID=1392488 RepID=UPI0004DF7ADA|nr:hypothetical protein [Flavimarina sp. Hel_I_48]
MNTVFVSGTLKTAAQLKMGDQGYIVTFKMVHEDEMKDSNGSIKAIATDWSVSLQYIEEPSDIISKLEKGVKVLVKGTSEISHQEEGGTFKMNCTLNGESLNIMDTASKKLQQNIQRQFADRQAMAS